MNEAGLAAARQKMTEGGVGELAIEVFSHYWRQLHDGATGLIAEADIEPITAPRLDEVSVAGSDALATTAVIKLNGGLGTSMGMDRAKSLLPVREGLTFLDIAVRQVLGLRDRHGVRLPLIFMNSFRTSADTMTVLASYPDLAVDDLPLEFLQNREPKLRAEDLAPVDWPADPTLEWCPPGHGDIYTALSETGLLADLIAAGYDRVFISNSDNLGAVPAADVAQWFAESGAPFAIESVRRTESDKKGGHLARRRADGRLVLRESAQTAPEDQAALADLDRHRYMSTNNIWIDLPALAAELAARDGVLGLPLIRNAKTVDPADPASPPVIQIESAMGAAIEVFDGAETIEVGRDRFVPVKTTNDLLVLRSDVYELDDDWLLNARGSAPFVDLAEPYKLIDDFTARIPHPLSLADADRLEVAGDWTFGRDVQVVGTAVLDAAGGAVPDGATLGDGAVVGER